METEATACGDASGWWADDAASADTPPPRCVSAAGATSSSQTRWRNHFVFCSSASVPHETKLPFCQREERTPPLMSGKGRKAAACRGGVDAWPVAATRVCKRWERTKEGQIWQTRRNHMYSPPCYSPPEHPEAPPKLLVKQINKYVNDKRLCDGWSGHGSPVPASPADQPLSYFTHWCRVCWKKDL